MKTLEHFSSFIPTELMSTSGIVFYSGHRSMTHEHPLMIIGLNPGGCPDVYAAETIAWHTQRVAEVFPKAWSAYRDDDWSASNRMHKGNANFTSVTATSRLQRRVLHMLEKLDMDPGAVPSSNIVFARSKRKATLEHDFDDLVEQCWPFHAERIRLLKPKVIVCMGGDSGSALRHKIGAHKQIGSFVEQNKRKWTNRLYEAPNGVRVAVLTHPAIADWTAPPTDPTDLVAQALA